MEGKRASGLALLASPSKPPHRKTDSTEDGARASKVDAAAAAEKPEAIATPAHLWASSASYKRGDFVPPARYPETE
jgi:hypothetical protein